MKRQLGDQENRTATVARISLNPLAKVSDQEPYTEQRCQPGPYYQ